MVESLASITLARIKVNICSTRFSKPPKTTKGLVSDAST